MGLFSSKKLIAELRIGLVNDNKVFISINNISTGDNIKLFEESKLPAFIFLFFLDRVLINMSEKVSIVTLDFIYTWGSQLMKKIAETNNSEKWLQLKSENKTPNNWIFSESEEDFAKVSFIATAKMFLKDSNIFCQTDFSRDQFTEAKSYLLIEALLMYVLEKSDFEDFTLYFLPALLAQCSFYNGKRLGLTQIGQAVHYGLAQAHTMRGQYGLEK